MMARKCRKSISTIRGNATPDNNLINISDESILEAVVLLIEGKNLDIDD